MDDSSVSKQLQSGASGSPVGGSTVTATGPRLFISYRREEAAGHAGRLYDAIATRFDDGNVFMDVDLAPGVDFVAHITEAVASCDVLLVVIGPRWTGLSDDVGRPRLADPNDFVRLEVETALGRPDVAVIPVLVGGARMPGGEELPESLRELSRRNALELSDQRWRYDVGRLLSTLSQLLKAPTEASGVPDVPSSVPARKRHSVTSGRGALLAGVLVVALGVVAAVLALAGVFSGGDQGGRPAATGNGAARQITSDDAVRAVGSYKTAYDAKDIDRLGKLLDPNVVLKQGRKPDVRGSRQVIAHYRAEFRRFGKERPTFDWTNAFADSGEEHAEAAGPYAISAGGRTRETGRFGLRLRSIGAQQPISELCFDCADLRPGGRIG
jgi:hypothetical protein